jgi:hypothetical protein
MKLGFARKDITPDFSVPLAGYGVNRISKGVHDKLYSRALFFEGAGAHPEPLILLQLDLLYMDSICVEKIRQGLSDVRPDGFTGNTAKIHLLICATHTHSGFGGIFNTESSRNRELLPLFGEYNPALVDLVVKRSLEAIAEAVGNCVETTVRIKKGTVEGVGTNRRRFDLPCDNSLIVMEFYRIDQKKILLYSLSCHPTVLNGKNLLLSADFPGAVAGKLEEIPGAYDMVVFINGSAGDISTRFTRKESGFDECNRYANIIINAISNLKKGVFLPLEKAELSYYFFSLQKADIPDKESAKVYFMEAERNLAELKSKNTDTAAIRKAESLVEGAQISLIKANCADGSESSDHKTVETGILLINTTVIICSPFELFSSLALILKGKKQIECFGYVNCCEGYLADCDAWDNLEYEALFSDFKRGEGERYIELVSSLIKGK